MAPYRRWHAPGGFYEQVHQTGWIEAREARGFRCEYLKETDADKSSGNSEHAIHESEPAGVLSPVILGQKERGQGKAGRVDQRSPHGDERILPITYGGRHNAARSKGAQL